jgi:hypothetical protein
MIQQGRPEQSFTLLKPPNCRTPSLLLCFRGIRPNSGSSHVFPDWLRHLAARQGDCADAGLRTVTTIGDAQTPSTIASAVYSGRKFGGELGLTVDDPALNIRRESPCRRTITRPLGPVLRCGLPGRQHISPRSEESVRFRLRQCPDGRRKADYCGWPASTVSGSPSTRAPS